MNVPQLRFDGFDGEWKSINLGSISDVTKLAGFEFTAHINYSDEGEVIALRGLNVKNGRLNLENVKYIDGSNFEKLSRSKLVENDLLFTYVGTIGEVAIIDENEKYYLAPNVARIRVNLEEVDSLFLMTLISSQKFYFKTIFPLIATSSQPALSMSNIRKFEISKPSLKEQQKIATFFSLINKKIEKQQEKIVRLEQFKKGMMQKIFSQELRFKDEDGGEFPEWEVRRLDELGSFYKGSGLSKSHLTPEGKPCILYGELYTKYSSVITKVCSYCNPKAKAFLGEVNDVLIPSSGETAWDIACASTLNVPDVVLGGDLNVFRPNQKIDGNFISYQINSIKKYELSNLAQGASVVHLYTAALKKLKMLIPTFEEQQKIARYFLSLETKIEKEKEKLMVLEEQKKGFMQGMFV